MSVQNPGMFWRTDDGRMGLLLSLNADKLAAFDPKACKKNIRKVHLFSSFCN